MQEHWTKSYFKEFLHIDRSRVLSPQAEAALFCFCITFSEKKNDHESAFLISVQLENGI